MQGLNFVGKILGHSRLVLLEERKRNFHTMSFLKYQTLFGEPLEKQPKHPPLSPFANSPLHLTLFPPAPPITNAEPAADPAPSTQQESAKSIEYAANLAIEDRISVGSLKCLNAQVLSVFDGHGGSKLSEYCAENIVELLDSFVSDNLEKEKYEGRIELLIGDALRYGYEKLEKDFFQNVFEEQIRLKNRKIKNVGSCGLTAVIHRNKLYIANCGDSMAIVVTQDQGKPGSVHLHERLSVNNPQERQRLYNEFPNDSDILVEENKGCFYLKGRLQPTRTLGDYHMKHQSLWKGRTPFNGPYVKSEPLISVHQINESFKYLVLASDGVWDFLSEEEVAESCIEGGEAGILERTLEKIAELNGKSVEEIKGIDPEIKRDFHDDIAVIVAPLQFSQ